MMLHRFGEITAISLHATFQNTPVTDFMKHHITTAFFFFIRKTFNLTVGILLYLYLNV